MHYNISYFYYFFSQKSILEVKDREQSIKEPSSWEDRMVQGRKIKSNKDDKTYRKAVTFEDTKQQKQTTTTFLSVKIKVNKINERNISRHDRYIFCYLSGNLKAPFDT